MRKRRTSQLRRTQVPEHIRSLPMQPGVAVNVNPYAPRSCFYFVPGFPQNTPGRGEGVGVSGGIATDCNRSSRLDRRNLLTRATIARDDK